MRKKIMTAATVAAVGISAYLGFGQKAEPTLTELQLANAEALTDIELDPVEVFCNTGGHGRCYFPVNYGLVTNDDFTKCFFLE